MIAPLGEPAPPRRRFVAARPSGGRRARALAWLTIVAATAGPARGAHPRLVVDIAPGDVISAGAGFSLDPPFAAARGDQVLFPLTSARSGAELWITDGTAAGTRLVRDLCPGPCSSDPRALVAAGDLVYFVAFDPIDETRRLFRTDGSAAGTVPILAAPTVEELATPAVVGDRLFFVSASASGTRLWSTDGTRGGTRPVAGICDLGCDALSFSELLPDRDGGLYLLLTALGPSVALWHLPADGPPVKLFDPGLPLARLVLGADGRAYFSLSSLCSGDFSSDELWVTDPTPGTARVVLPGGGGAGADPILPWAFAPAPQGSGAVVVLGTGGGVGSGLWITDGTRDGTRLVFADPQAGVPTDFVALGALGLFRTTGEGPDRLWVTGGSAASTRELAIPALGAFQLVAGADRAYLAALDALALSDGTAGGTRLVRRWEAGAGFRILRPVAVGPGLLFAGHDSDDFGADPWWSDGSAAGTVPLVDLSRAPDSSTPHALTTLDETLLFAAGVNPAVFGDSLWRSGGDGVVELTAVRSEIESVTLDGSLALIGAAGALLRTDGTPEGTEVLSDAVGVAGPLRRLGSRHYFAGARRDIGVELWRTDGSADGTRLVRDLFPGVGGFPHTGPLSGSPRSLAALDERLVFQATSARGAEPWWSDGRRTGTARLGDLRPGSEGSDPHGFTPVPGRRRRAVFAATDGDGDRELWLAKVPSGTTVRLADLDRTGSSSPHGFTALGADVFFFARLAAGGEGLFRTDGTARGTRLIVALGSENDPVEVAAPASTRAGRDAIDRTRIVPADGSIFFVARDAGSGAELWTTDGTAAGTRLVVDLVAGPGGSDPGELRAIDGVVVFAADDGVHGRELWTSDGTAAGTRLLADVAPGGEGSNPKEPTAVGGEIVFQADDGRVGRELWAIDRGALESAFERRP